MKITFWKSCPRKGKKITLNPTFFQKYLYLLPIIASWNGFRKVYFPISQIAKRVPSALEGKSIVIALFIRWQTQNLKIDILTWKPGFFLNRRHFPPWLWLWNQQYRTVCRQKMALMNWAVSIVFNYLLLCGKALNGLGERRCCFSPETHYNQ